MTLPPSIQKIEQEISEEFGFLEDWSDKYEHLLSLARALPPMPAEDHSEENKVRGCQSNVWLTAKPADGRVWYSGDSDALIVKGLVAMMVRLLSGQKPEDIISSKLDFLQDTGLQAHLSPTRNNGLSAMVKQMKLYALAFHSQS